MDEWLRRQKSKKNSLRRLNGQASLTFPRSSYAFQRSTSVSIFFPAFLVGLDSNPPSYAQFSNGLDWFWGKSSPLFGVPFSNIDGKETTVDRITSDRDQLHVTGSFELLKDHSSIASRIHQRGRQDGERARLLNLAGEAKFYANLQGGHPHRRSWCGRCPMHAIVGASDAP